MKAFWHITARNLFNLHINNSFSSLKVPKSREDNAKFAYKVKFKSKAL